ncbi:MAG: protein translocase subunit SecF [Cellulosilyticaceae bacterium]
MNFITNRKKFFALSLAIILIGLITMPFQAMKGNEILNYDIEFKGGTVLHLDVGQAFDINEDMRPLVEEYLGDTSARIQNVPDTNEVIITSKETDAEKRSELVKAIKEKYAIEGNPILVENSVSPSISPEIKAAAIEAVLLGTVLMLIYISIRFKDFKFGASAVAGLIHDVLIMLAVYAVFRIPINNSFIAAMLTIIGYSINDTIIVFDRIRENKGRMKGDDEEVINTSIQQTLSRSINTSITTLVMVVLLYLLGASSVKDFAFPLVIGIISGTYSSIFIASPVWFEMRKYQRNKKVKGKTA